MQYVFYSIIFLALIAIVIITITLAGRENPEFTTDRSENFNNVTHYEGKYRNETIKVSPEFDWVEFKGEKYYKDNNVYRGNNKTLYFKDHILYYIEKPVLKDNAKKEHKIPKIIWQTMKEEPVIDTLVYDAVQTFKNQKGWEHRFMTDEKAKVFLKENFDEEVLHAFEVLIPGAYKADLLRACLLYIHGGVYADSKLFLHYDLDSFLDRDLVLVKEKNGYFGFWNGFLASIPKHPFFKLVIDSIVSNVAKKHYGNGILDICGPTLYGNVFYDNFEENDALILLANNLKNDNKNFINEFKNQELFITWSKDRSMYTKIFKSFDYSELWRKKEVYDLNLHKKYFGILFGDIKEFHKTDKTFNFLWSKGLHEKTEYTQKDTESHHPKEIDLSKDVIWVRSGSNGGKSDINHLSKMLDKIKTPKIFVTTDGDLSIPSGLKKDVVNSILNNKYITKWYTQNYDGTNKNPKLKPFPIGLDLHTPKYQKINLPIARVNKILEIRNTEKTKIPKIFCDTHLHTYNKFNNERKRVHQMLKDKKYIKFLNKRISQTEIWENYSKYDFTISTHGNGLDCHRTWEIILLGGTVVTKTSSLDPLFKGLPVIIVKDWDECTEENLVLWKNKFDKTNEYIYKFFTYDHWLSN